MSRNRVLETANRNQILALCDCCLNVLEGTHKISAHVRRGLSRYKKTLRYVAYERRAHWKKKRTEMLQRGGFIVPLLASLFSGLLGRLIGSS